MSVGRANNKYVPYESEMKEGVKSTPRQRRRSLRVTWKKIASRAFSLGIATSMYELSVGKASSFGCDMFQSS